MEIVNVCQGTDLWHQFRLEHFGASEAAAMLGLSKKVKRTELLHAKHTGIPREFSDWVQTHVLDHGHEVEALARPIVEDLIADTLYPITCSDGKLSASCDGLTLGGEVAFEHKQWAAELAAFVQATGTPPDEHVPQCQQVLMVTGAQRLIFVVSNGTREQMVHCWVEPDPQWFKRIRAGWEQFERDLADYKPAEVAPVVVAAPVQSLPAVAVIVEGQITVRDNFAAFETALRDFLEHRLIREPKTDNDFATLDVQIKAMKGAEAALDSAEAQMLAQIQTVDQAKRTKDMLSKLVRDNRLMAEKLLASEKDRRRGEIVAGGVKALQEHVASLNARLGEPYMPQVPADFGGTTKGKKSLSSMEDAVSTELARAKIAANEIADRIQANMKALVDAGDGASFPDARTLVLKAPEDLQAIIAQRVAEAQRRLEEQRERIRQEEAAKLAREQEAAEAARAAAEALAQAPTIAPHAALVQTPAEPASIAPAVVPLRPARAATADTAPPTLKLGAIQERLGFPIPGAFVADTLGIQPAATDKAAKLYRESDFDRICIALIRHIEAVRQGQNAEVLA